MISESMEQQPLLSFLQQGGTPSASQWDSLKMNHRVLEIFSVLHR
jgi:hypothetical protein